MEHIVLIKKNGKTQVKKLNDAQLIKLKRALTNNYLGRHLCWDNCKNANGSDCEKVFDETKKIINKYDFIIDGCEILKTNKKVDILYVFNCSKYIEEEKKDVNSEEYIKGRKLSRELKMNYFEATSYEEANTIQYNLMKKGLIKNIRGRVCYPNSNNNNNNE